MSQSPNSITTEHPQRGAPPRWVGSKQVQVPQPFPSSLLPGLDLRTGGGPKVIHLPSSKSVYTLAVRLSCDSQKEVGYVMERDKGGLLALQPTLSTLRFATTHSRLLARVP